MKTNIQLINDVQDALHTIANFKLGEIGVTATDGTIMLWGIQTTNSRIRMAEETTKRVSGVDEIVNLIYKNVSTTYSREKRAIEVELESYLDGRC